MADLSKKDASSSNKIVGAASDGTESNFAEVSANGDLQAADLLRGPGVQGVLTVGTGAVELKVGGSVLADRKLATFYNDSSNVIYWGYTNAVTTSTGTPIEKKQLASWDVSDGATIWLIAASASNDGRITESA